VTWDCGRWAGTPTALRNRRSDEPLDVPPRFAGQWTLASLVLDTFEPVAHGQRFYFGQWKFAPPGPNVIVDAGKV
jgi:hypothetical protein